MSATLRYDCEINPSPKATNSKSSNSTPVKTTVFVTFGDGRAFRLSRWVALISFDYPTLILLVAFGEMHVTTH